MPDQHQPDKPQQADCHPRIVRPDCVNCGSTAIFRALHCEAGTVEVCEACLHANAADHKFARRIWPPPHKVIFDDAHGHPGVDRCEWCDSNSTRSDWSEGCKRDKATAGSASFPLCPKCKNAHKMMLDAANLLYSCSSCKTTWSRNYLKGWNDGYTAMTDAKKQRGNHSGKVTDMVWMRAKEERDAQKSAATPQSENMHGYAANRLESVLLAFGLSLPNRSN